MPETQNTIDQLAKLSRLDIDPAEHDALEKKLSSVLEYVGQLKSVVPDGVPPSRDDQAPLRNDEPHNSAARQAILDQAPERVEDWWKVSAVFS